VHLWTPFFVLSIARSSSSVDHRSAPPQEQVAGQALVTIKSRRHHYLVQHSLPVRFSYPARPRKPLGVAAVVPCHAGGEVLDAVNILTESNANMADDVDLAHLSACVARYRLGIKSIWQIFEISENIRNLEKSYLFHFKSEKYK
jgi:hypothetical protein